MTRRIVLAGLASTLAAAAQEFTQEFGDGDTHITFIQSDALRYSIGVRTSIKADWAVMEVFYRDGILESSVFGYAPVGGEYIYGDAFNFSIPHENITHVDLLFLRLVAERRIEVGKP